jgi:hypothetical protein
VKNHPAIVWADDDHVFFPAAYKLRDGSLLALRQRIGKQAIGFLSAFIRAEKITAPK